MLILHRTASTTLMAPNVNGAGVRSSSGRRPGNVHPNEGLRGLGCGQSPSSESPGPCLTSYSKALSTSVIFRKLLRLDSPHEALPHNETPFLQVPPKYIFCLPPHSSFASLIVSPTGMRVLEGRVPQFRPVPSTRQGPGPHWARQSRVGQNLSQP